jgi:hypothetical protein
MSEADDYLHCGHLLVNHAPLHFQWRMLSRQHMMHATKIKPQKGKSNARSGDVIPVTATCNSCALEEHMEVLIDKEMLSKLPLLAAMYESSEEDTAPAPYKDEAQVDVKKTTTIFQAFQALLHDSEGVEGALFSARHDHCLSPLGQCLQLNSWQLCNGYWYHS